MSAFTLTVENAILQDGKLVPASADGKYAAKYQVKVIHPKGDFYLSSASVDLSAFPMLQPVRVVAGCNRLAGAKSFHVVEVDHVEVVPVSVVPGGKK